MHEGQSHRIGDRGNSTRDPDHRPLGPVERPGALVPAAGAGGGPGARRRHRRGGRNRRHDRPLHPRSLARARRLRARLCLRRRLVEHDFAARRRRLGARRRPANDRRGQGRHPDPFRRARLRLAQRRRLHPAVGDALLRPLEAQFARPHPVLLGRAPDGSPHHELRLRRRAGAGTGRSRFGARRPAPIRRSPTRSGRTRSSISPPPSATRSGCGRTSAARTFASIGCALRQGRSERCSSGTWTRPANSSASPPGTIRSPPTARPPSPP